MRFMFIISLILLTASAKQDGTVVKGIVNDQDQKPVSGVLVSDGFNVVKTDKKGKYSLPVDKRAKFVFVTTPSDYIYKESFYYLLEGLNGKCDFSLVKQSDVNDHFIQLSDTEERMYDDWIDGLKEYISIHNPSFIAFTGDICYEPGLRMHAREITDESMGCRVIYTMGNHDLIRGGLKGSGGEDRGELIFEELFGPVWYSFDSRNIHYVILPMLSGDSKPSFTPDDVYNWLRKDLDNIPEGMPVIILTHAAIGNDDALVFKTDNQELDLRKYNIKGYFYGHYHTDFHHLSDNNVAFFCSMSPNKGGIDHTPASFRRVNVDQEGNITTELRYASLDNYIATMVVDNGEEVEVYAMIYDTNSDVQFALLSVNEEDFADMEQSEINPYIWRVTVPGDEAVNMRITAHFEDGERSAKLVDRYSNGESGFDLKWMTEIPARIMFTTPVISGDILIVAGADDDGGNVKEGAPVERNCGIYAFDKYNGDPVWTYNTINSIKNDIVVEGGIVYALDVRYNLYAINADTGELIYHKALRKGKMHPAYSQGLGYSDGMLFGGQAVEFYGLRASDGEIVWNNDQWSGGVNGITGTLTGAGVVYTSSYWKGRYAHDEKSGKMLWEKKDDRNRISDNSPVFVDGHLFYATEECLAEVDALSGEELRMVKVPYKFNVKSPPLVTNDFIVIGTADKGVAAFKRGDFSEVWNYKINPALIYTSPYTKDFQMTVESGVVQYKDKVIFGANDTYLYMLDLETGRYRDRFHTGMPILATPVVEGNYIYVANFAGMIMKFRLR